jgi:hypothetical protein
MELVVLPIVFILSEMFLVFFPAGSFFLVMPLMFIDTNIRDKSINIEDKRDGHVEKYAQSIRSPP